MTRKRIDSEELALRIVLLVSIAPSLFLGMVVIMSVIDMVKPEKHDIDSGFGKYWKRQLIVTDSTYNGFEIIYSTKRAVTQERYDEIMARPGVRDSLKNLERDAPAHFGNMLYTDIYDFGEFAMRYHPDPDLVISSLYVYGKKKENLYVGPNPKIRNPGTSIDPLTQQGILYIWGEDLESHITYGSRKIYRYWKCPPPYQVSDTDEHFSHFSEDDRLY